MIIGIDFDGTINNMLDTWVAWLNKKHGTCVKVEDITEWELSKAFPSLSKTELFEPLDAPEFWRYVTIKPGAIEVIQQLIKEGHRVYIVTSSHYRILSAKFDNCLFRYLPFLHKEDVIITYDKSLIRCDVLLDDYPNNFRNFNGIKILYDQPYNKTADFIDFRVHNWEEFYNIINQLNNLYIM